MPEFKTYIGTKLIRALPMTRKFYNDYRGWDLPENEQHLATEAGYLVEYLDGGRSNDPRHVGYISWSPADVFEKSYRQSDAMSFSLALEALKLGERVQRAGWNGKGMYLYLVPAGRYPPSTAAGRMLAQMEPDGLVPYAPYLAMKTAQGYIVPWLASQTDLIDEDWVLYNEGGESSGERPG